MGGIRKINIAAGEHKLTDIKQSQGFPFCMIDFAIELIGESHTTVHATTIVIGMFELLPNGTGKANKKGSIVYEKDQKIIMTNLGIRNPTDKHGDKTVEQPTTRGVWSDRGLPLTLNSCEIFDCKGDAIYIRGGSYIRLNRCHLHGNKCQGLYLSGAGTLGLTIDLHINNNGDSGLYVNRGADVDIRGYKTKIHLNGMYKEERYGIKASGTDSEIRIHLPKELEFLTNNGLHVEDEDTGEYYRSPKAKNMLTVFNGTINHIKMSKKQMLSYKNYLKTQLSYEEKAKNIKGLIKYN
jgi:hypothetical protein|tara:strand:- start:307 stop:1191 length:885 start_codon:yes stop_codon:yes gene_type:complete